MQALATLIHTAFTLYIYLLIAAAIMSWLTAFHVINVRNRFVFMVVSFLFRITDPALRPIRRIIPTLGGIDISPVILIVLLYFLRDLILQNLF